MDTIRATTRREGTGLAAHHRGPALALALPLAIGLTAAAAAASPAASADASCAVVARAATAALAQARIHAAIDSPLDPEAVKAGMKPTLMHSIVVDRVQYSNAIRASFSRTTLESGEMRALAADLGPFMVESGCKAVANDRVAAREALVFTAAGDLGRGEIRFRLWIDRITGLPLHAISDEPAVDVDAIIDALNRKKGRPAGKAGGQRRLATHAYLFGNAVKPPDASGRLDPAALAELQALLKGTP